jgi:hypothetical protein
VRAVATRFRALGQYEGTTFRDPSNLALQDAELGRIDEIVRGIDRE